VGDVRRWQLDRVFGYGAQYRSCIYNTHTSNFSNARGIQDSKQANLIESARSVSNKL
jgi:hypothetical protein